MKTKNEGQEFVLHFQVPMMAHDEMYEALKERSIELSKSMGVQNQYKLLVLFHSERVKKLYRYLPKIILEENKPQQLDIRRVFKKLIMQLHR